MRNPVEQEAPVLANALLAGGPAPDRAEKMMLYGQFVGSWDGRVVVHEATGTRRESTSEVHFGWVLGGRAVQDVWIAPARGARKPAEQDRMYGTTLRVYDPQSDVWHITWIDPVRQAYDRMIGRKVGENIVQEYRNQQGTLCQWLFTEITVDSFHWIARDSADESGAWNVRAEFFLRRRSAACAGVQP
jgi:hypothetical protein